MEGLLSSYLAYRDVYDQDRELSHGFCSIGDDLTNRFLMLWQLYESPLLMYSTSSSPKVGYGRDNCACLPIIAQSPSLKSAMDTTALLLSTSVGCEMR